MENASNYGGILAGFIPRGEKGCFLYYDRHTPYKDEISN